MSLYLLDGIGAGFLVYFFGIGLLFIISLIFIEAIVMFWLKYQPLFKTAFLQSLAVNLLSLAGGFLLIKIDSDLFALDNYAGFGLMFLATLLLETLLLYRLNRNKLLKQTIFVSILMNIVTYLMAFFIIQPFNN